MKTAICSKCKKEQSIIEFYKDKQKRNGLHSWCKTCQIKRWKNYKKNYPVRVWAKTVLYHHKKRGYIVNITRQEIENLAKSTKYCSMCDSKLEYVYGVGRGSMSRPTVDRINNEQTMNKNNVWIICRKCNATKQNRTFKEFVIYCKMITDKFLTEEK